MRYFKNLRFNRAHEIGMDGEVVLLSTLEVSLNREIDGTEHNYNIHVYPSKNGGYGLAIYLAMTGYNANNILVYRKNYELEKEAEKDACRVINELEKSDLKEYIEDWKFCSIQPVFDEKYNLVGDVYTSILTLQKSAKSFDYYNDSPLDNYYGNFYILKRINNKNCYEKATVGLNNYISKTLNDKKTLIKLLSKLNKKKYNRFFE